MNDKEYGYCLRCGRRLKNDKTKKLGYGDVCMKKIKTNQKNRLFNIPESVII